MTSRWLTGLGVLVIAAALFGCADPDQFGLRLTWTAGPTQACPRGAGGATSCAAIPLSCGARARLRIVDGQFTGIILPGEPDYDLFD